MCFRFTFNTKYRPFTFHLFKETLGLNSADSFPICRSNCTLAVRSVSGFNLKKHLTWMKFTLTLYSTYQSSISDVNALFCINPPSGQSLQKTVCCGRRGLSTMSTLGRCQQSNWTRTDLSSRSSALNTKVVRSLLRAATDARHCGGVIFDGAASELATEMPSL